MQMNNPCTLERTAKCMSDIPAVRGIAASYALTFLIRIVPTQKPADSWCSPGSSRFGLHRRRSVCANAYQTYTMLSGCYSAGSCTARSRLQRRSRVGHARCISQQVVASEPAKWDMRCPEAHPHTWCERTSQLCFWCRMSLAATTPCVLQFLQSQPPLLTGVIHDRYETKFLFSSIVKVCLLSCTVPSTEQVYA